MSQLDELLARSRAPGAFVERRHFTLSREKAIEKQREFALRDPRQYVLEIVQGAIFAGATYLAVDARKHDILIAWVGAPPLERAHLENLFDYLFADRTDPRIRHMVQLAVGINALLQRRPDSITIESGTVGNTLRFDMKPDGQADIGTVDTGIGGTYLVARFGGGWFGRFLSPPTETRVEELIEERCLYTPVPILLNGSAPFGYRATRRIEIFGHRAQAQFDEGDRRGVIALHSSARAPRGFRIVVGGVWVTQLPLLEISDQHVIGVICDDNLRKTADHADIVQDDRFARMLHAVQPHATRMLREVLGPSYRPPALPPAPDEAPAAPAGEGGPVVPFESLPEHLAMVGPRGSTTVEDLEQAGDEPLFWCTAEVGTKLGTAVADPLRFPFRIVILTEGQANTLGQQVPGVHRLNGPSDIDFVLRVMERGQDMREVRAPLHGPDSAAPLGEVVVRLHRGGRLPAWGNGAPGVPVLVRSRGRTVQCGAIDGARVQLTRIAPYELATALDLPGISLVIELRAREPDPPDDEIARRVLDIAWQLVLPPGWQPGEPVPDCGEAETRLLAALLASQSLPQLVELPHPHGGHRDPAAQVSLAAGLPPSWPQDLRQIPLVQTHRGPLDLDGFLALIQQGEVAWVRDPEGYARMELLEARFGYGHLAPHGVDAAPLFAAVQVWGQWRWVAGREVWREQAAFTQMVCVTRHLAPREPGAPGTSDPSWVVVAQPGSALLAMRRADLPAEADPGGLDEGWQTLFDGLRGVEAKNMWARYAVDASLTRVQALGRLALLQLASEHAGRLEAPLLPPSDHGARWTLARLRSDPAVRVAAANGVAVAEPHTFLLTLDELRAAGGPVPPALRYDDHPDVWRSLAETADAGWLIRTEIHEARLRGWLGLRLPYDPTSGILLRATGQLAALPELDARIPCHGLLWPVHGGGSLSPDEARLLQLAGLRMYAQLLARLRGRLAPDEARAAQLYAWAFCWSAHRRGRLTGTAMQLARQVEVRGEDGRTWGTLDRWLETAAARRPPAPPELPLPPEPELAQEPPPEGTRLTRLTDRLNAALGGVRVEVALAERGQRGPVAVGWAAFEGTFVTLAPNAHQERTPVMLNAEHGLVRAGAQAAGPAQELLLLEIVRQVARNEAELGRELDVVRAHQVLLAQRLEA